MLIASNTETITILADVDFTGGAVTAAYSTVVIGGVGSQAVNLGNQSFYKINVSNAVGPVTFGAGFAATELRCEATSGQRSLMFEPGSTCTVRSLVLLSASATTNILLRSAVEYEPWNLIVTGGASVRGVDVADSDASGGKPIYAIASEDRLSNANWIFDANVSTWIGSNGASFHGSANWSPAGVPGATSRVLIDGPNSVSITSAVTVLDLLVVGNLTVNSNLTVVSNLTVQSGGTVTMNRLVIVSNDVYVLAGGMLTHSANGATDVNKLNLSVLGNVGVDLGAAVNVTAKGYGISRSGPGGESSGSYGGCGAAGAACYGSIVAPTNLGSAGANYAGGGAIIMTVSGTILNDGLLCADGGSGGYSGAGGSIYLVSGMLQGSGTIRANGGNGSGFPAGGGGRVSLVVTNTGADFSQYTGFIQAIGGSAGAGAGTIYQQRAVDHSGRGTVLVNNSYSGYTDFPPSTNYVPGEVERTLFYVTNAARFRLVNNFSVGDIWLQSTNANLDLNFRTLTVHSKPHVLSGIVTNYGAIIWIPDVVGTTFTIR